MLTINAFAFSREFISSLETETLSFVTFELLGSEEILLFTSSSTASLLTFILLNT